MLEVNGLKARSSISCTSFYPNGNNLKLSHNYLNLSFNKMRQKNSDDSRVTKKILSIGN